MLGYIRYILFEDDCILEFNILIGKWLEVRKIKGKEIYI